MIGAATVVVVSASRNSSALPEWFAWTVIAVTITPLVVAVVYAWRHRKTKRPRLRP